MPVLDVFDADAFTVVSLTKAVNQISHVPTVLSRMPGIVENVPIRTKAVWIERQGDQPALIQTSARGTEPSQISVQLRDARAFQTFRLSQGSRITADSLLGIRAFGSEVDVKDVQTEVASRMARINRRFDLTMEYHLLNLVCAAKTFDAKGATIYDWTSEFSAAPPGGRTLTTLSETAFNLSAQNPGSVRLNANAIVRGILRNLETAEMQVDDTPISAVTAQVVAVCGDAFYDQLVTHTDVKSTFVNWQDAAKLREDVGAPWQPFMFAGIEWINYRGTNDTTGQAADTTGYYSGASFGVGTNHAKFFPRSAGIFQMAYAPGEDFESLGTLGQQRYARIVRDMQRDRWVDVEVESYPLPVCVLPQALASGRAGT